LGWHCCCFWRHKDKHFFINCNPKKSQILKLEKSAVNSKILCTFANSK
jgi:hypothetical protein